MIALLVLWVGPVAAEASAAPVTAAAHEPADAGPGTAEAHPDDEQDGEDDEAALLEERVRVVGSSSRATEISGSVHFVGEDELSKHEYSDVQRALRRVPGVYLQDEDGYGLRPNIGMRGSGVERSQKVTLMEDGVLIAPAPYAAPSAYYFPTAGRMEAMEVSKGPSSIRQGPFTNGGVLNMISSAIPTSLGGAAELAFGEDDNLRAKLRVGDSHERFGWSFETFQQQTDGFKELDGGGGTGFELEDYVVKLRFNSRPGAPVYHALELKLGSTDQEGDETYLGLTQADFDRSPFRRYAASAADSITADHEQIQLRHFVVPTDRLDLTTTLYYNDFSRNWRKLEEVGGFGISSVLATPDDPLYSGLIEILRGETDSAPDSLGVRNNRRDYYSSGIQAVLGLRLGSTTRHAFEFGVRYHEDEEDRFQEEDGYRMLHGSIVQTSLGAAGSHSNRISDADAIALFVRDEMTRGKWNLSPGIRFESIDYTRRDYGTADPQRSGTDLSVRRNSVDEIIPGLGVGYELTDQWRLFGGAHKGFAPPGPGRTRRPIPSRATTTSWACASATRRCACFPVPPSVTL